MSAPFCPIHNLEAKWKEGVSKTSNKPYAFWSCPIKKEQNGGEYCPHKFDVPKTNTQKFTQSLDAADSLNAQSKKDSTITNLAIIKELIAAGRKYGVETVAEFHKWKALAEGRTLKIEAPKEEEVDLGSIPF